MNEVELNESELNESELNKVEWKPRRLSRRDCVSQPRVARECGLPWGFDGTMGRTPKGFRPHDVTPSG